MLAAVDPLPRLKIEAYGVRVGIRLVPPIEPDEVIKRLPPGYRDVTCPTLDRCYEVRLEPTEEHELKYHVLADGVILAVRRLLGRALDELESDLELFIAAQTRECMFVHAGVVSWRGRAIVLPGRSLSGKTTLVIELLKAGADYYSDEFAVFDAHGLIHP